MCALALGKATLERLVPFGPEQHRIYPIGYAPYLVGALVLETSRHTINK